MVAFSSLEEQVGFATGKLRLKTDEISSEAWLAFIRAAATELPMNVLLGLKTVGQILAHEGRVPRNVPTPFPMLRLTDPTGEQQDGLEIPANRTFLALSSRENFPYEWKDAPRHEVPAEHGLTDRVLDEITCEHLLLSRTCKLALLRTRWLPKEEWDHSYMETSPEKFWYELDHRSPDGITISEPTDEELVRWLSFRDDHIVSPPRLALYSMQTAMRETVDHFADWLRHSRKQHRVINETIERVGGGV